MAFTEAERIERKRASRRRSYRKNREAISARRKVQAVAWTPEQRAERKAYLQDYCRRNSARAVARSMAWVRASPDRMEKKRAACRAWLKANADKAARYCATRRAQKLQATPAWLTAEHHALIASFYELANDTGLDVDHKTPLRGKTVCGLHVPWNLQLLTPLENRRKGNRI